MYINLLITLASFFLLNIAKAADNDWVAYTTRNLGGTIQCSSGGSIHIKLEDSILLRQNPKNNSTQVKLKWKATGFGIHGSIVAGDFSVSVGPLYPTTPKLSLDDPVPIDMSQQNYEDADETILGIPMLIDLQSNCTSDRCLFRFRVESGNC